MEFKKAEEHELPSKLTISLYTGYHIYCVKLDKDESVEYMFREITAFLEEYPWSSIDTRVVAIQGKYFVCINVFVSKKEVGLHISNSKGNWVYKNAEATLRKLLTTMRRNLP